MAFEIADTFINDGLKAEVLRDEKSSLYGIRYTDLDADKVLPLIQFRHKTYWFAVREAMGAVGLEEPTKPISPATGSFTIL